MLPIQISDVRVHPGDSAFLLDDGKTSILYDSGFAFTGYKVAENIKKILGERPLDYIFLTHSHYDHALGSVYARRYWPNVQVVAGEYTAKIFAKPTARSVMRELDSKFAAKCGVTEYEDLIDELRVDIPVQDGQIVQAGDMRFTAVSLPGHTKCSTAFYLAEHKLLLACETIGVYAGGGVVVPSCLVGYGMTIASIEKAEELDAEYMLLPHYGLVEREEADMYRRNAKKSVVETAGEIAAHLRAGETKEEAARLFREKFYHGYVKTIYPEDAMELNTGIMVKLIEKELVLENE